MRKLTLAALLAGAAAFASISPANAVVSLSVLDGVTPVVLACLASPGNITCSGSDANFSTINAIVTGFPNVPSPDLGTVSLSVESSVGGTHTLTFEGLQSGISSPGPLSTTTTDTFNGLIGGPGPVTYQQLVNGLILNSTSLGPAAGVLTAVFNNSTGTITSDEQIIKATFTAANQDLEATMEFAATPVVPLPATLPLFASGLAGLGLLGWRRKKAAAC